MACDEFDLDEFDFDEIIEHLNWNQNELTRSQVNTLRRIIKDCEYCFAQEELDKNEIYQKIKSLSNSLNDIMKLEVILSNINKFNYEKICEIFEK